MIARLMDGIDAREAWSSEAASLDVDSPQSRDIIFVAHSFRTYLPENFSVLLGKEIVSYIFRNEARHYTFTLHYQGGLASPYCRTSSALPHPTTLRLTTDQNPTGGDRQQKS